RQRRHRVLLGEGVQFPPEPPGPRREQHRPVPPRGPPRGVPDRGAHQGPADPVPRHGRVPPFLVVGSESRTGRPGPVILSDERSAAKAAPARRPARSALSGPPRTAARARSARPAPFIRNLRDRGVHGNRPSGGFPLIAAPRPFPGPAPTRAELGGVVIFPAPSHPG